MIKIMPEAAEIAEPHAVNFEKKTKTKSTESLNRKNELNKKTKKILLKIDF